MPDMNCIDFERLLNEALDEREPLENGALGEHAKACADCREIWQRHALLDRAVRAWRADVPRVDLVDAVLSRLAFDGTQAAARPRPASPPRRTSTRNAVAVLLTAAAVLVLLAAWLGRLESSKTDIATDQRANDQRANDAAPVKVTDRRTNPDRPNPPAPEDAVEPADLDLLVRNAGSAYLGLVDEAKGTVSEASSVMPSLAADSSPPESPGLDEPPDWDAGWQEEIKPLSDKVQHALNLFWDVLPRTPAPAS
ncbi:MAG: hypothetical protein ACREJB_07550 [Planctomycetaceae bacterium]